MIILGWAMVAVGIQKKNCVRPGAMFSRKLEHKRKLNADEVKRYRHNLTRRYENSGSFGGSNRSKTKHKTYVHNEFSG